MIVSAIFLAKVSWPTMIAAIAVIGTIAFNVSTVWVAKSRLKSDEVAGNIAALTVIYKELVDDLREEVTRLKEANVELALDVTRLRLDNENLSQAVRDLTAQIQALRGPA